MGGRRVRSRINGIGTGIDIVCLAQVDRYKLVYTNPCVYVEPAPGVLITVYYVSVSTINIRFISLELLLTCLDLGASSRSSRRTGVQSHDGVLRND